MRVALCLSGYFRTFRYTYTSLQENVINPLNCDVFIHTWDTINTVDATSAWYAGANKDLFTGTHLDLINGVYQPKNIVIESSNEILSLLKEEANRYAPHLNNPSVPKHPAHMASQYYKIWLCNDLRKDYEYKHRFKYDVVIRCRPDLFFNEKINMQDLYHSKNKLFFPSLYNLHGGLNDQFAFSSSEIMDAYSMMFHSLSRYFRGGGEYYPEKFLDWYIKSLQIPIAFSNVNYFIRR